MAQRSRSQKLQHSKTSKSAQGNTSLYVSQYLYLQISEGAALPKVISSYSRIPNDHLRREKRLLKTILCEMRQSTTQPVALAGFPLHVAPVDAELHHHPLRSLPLDRHLGCPLPHGGLRPAPFKRHAQARHPGREVGAQ